MPATIRVGVLGPVAVEGGNGELSPALRRLLAILVARRAEVVSTDSLAEWMWPEGAPTATAYGPCVRPCRGFVR